MTQQLDPKQVRGLKEELDTLDSMAKIKTIGANLTLSDEGELSATGGGGGGGGTLYSTLGENIDGALTQKASTDLLAHKDDFDTLSGTVGSLSNTVGTHTTEISGLTTAVAGKEPSITAGTTSQYWRGDKSWQTLDKTAVGLGNVDNTSDATKKSNFTGSIASANTGFVTGGDVYSAGYLTSVGTGNITDSAVTTAKINDGAVTTAKLDSEAVTTAKIDDGAVTTAKIASGAVTASNIDFTTMPGNYSTSETNTGYTWVDGKTIYKKTIYISSLPNNTTGYYDHNISNMETPVKIDATLMDSGETSGWAVPYKMVDLVSVNSTRIEVETLYDFSTYRMYVTIYYTKSS